MSNTGRAVMRSIIAGTGRLGMVLVLVFMCVSESVHCRDLRVTPPSGAKTTLPSPAPKPDASNTQNTKNPKPDMDEQERLARKKADAEFNRKYNEYEDEKYRLRMAIPKGWVFEAHDEKDSELNRIHEVRFTPEDDAFKYHRISSSDSLIFRLIETQEDKGMDERVSEVIDSYSEQNFKLSSKGEDVIIGLPAVWLIFAGKEESGERVTVNCLLAKRNQRIYSLQGRAKLATAEVNRGFVATMGRTLEPF
jgi:hypothetical protein